MSATKQTKMSSSNMSLCIPRVFPNITWKRVKEVFEELGLGKVERVDMVNKTNEKGEKFKRVFVHFKHWNKGKTVQAVKDKLESGDFVKIVYDDPWFWKVYKSDAPKPVFEKKPKAAKKDRKAPRLMGDEEHPGAPTPAAAAQELQQLKEMMLAQQQQMEMLRQQLMMEQGVSGMPKVERACAGSGYDSPAYRPSSPLDGATTPPYSPPSPVAGFSIPKPKLTRQIATGRDTDSDDEVEANES